MEEEKQDANQEESSALESAIAESETANGETQGTETATPQKAESQEEEAEAEVGAETNVPFHKHPRFKEVLEDRDWYKRQWEQSVQNRQPQNPQQPVQDPYANMTPDEERFWRAVDQRAERIAEQKIQKVNPLIDAGRSELAQMKVAQFRSSHPDIKANSPDEYAIAQRIQSGYNPEDAYWAVMGPRGKQQAKQEVKQEVKQRIAEKKQANGENNSIPANSSRNQPETNFKDDFLKNLRLAEEGKI